MRMNFLKCLTQNSQWHIFNLVPWMCRNVQAGCDELRRGVSCPLFSALNSTRASWGIFTGTRNKTKHTHAVDFFLQRRPCSGKSARVKCEWNIRRSKDGGTLCTEQKQKAFCNLLELIMASQWWRLEQHPPVASHFCFHAPSLYFRCFSLARRWTTKKIY